MHNRKLPTLRIACWTKPPWTLLPARFISRTIGCLSAILTASRSAARVFDTPALARAAGGWTQRGRECPKGPRPRELFARLRCRAQPPVIAALRETAAPKSSSAARLRCSTESKRGSLSQLKIERISHICAICSVRDAKHCSAAPTRIWRRLEPA